MSEAQPSFVSTLRQIASLLNKKQSVRLIFLLVAMVIGAFLEMVGVGAIPIFLSVLLGQGASSELFEFLPINAWVSDIDRQTVILGGAGFLLGFFAVKNIFISAINFFSSWFIKSVMVATTSRLFSAYLKSPYLLHLQRNPARSIRTLTSDMDMMRNLMIVVLFATRESAVMVMIFAALIAADPLVSSGTVFVLGACSSIFYVSLRKTLSKSGLQLQKYSGLLLQQAHQSISSFKIARILSHESYLISEFENAADNKERQRAVQRFLLLLPRLFLEVVAISSILVIVLFFLYLGRPPQEILPILALISVAIIRLVPIVTLLTGTLVQLQAGRASVAAIMNDLATFEETDASHQFAPTSDQLNVQTGPFERLEVKQLGFTFPGNPAPVLSDVTFDITAGMSVGIVGPSGSGKSTLVDIIMGLVDPDNGTVLIDGKDIHQERTALWSVFGYIPQDIYLMDSSIRQNIAFGLPVASIDEGRIHEVLKEVQLDKLINDLPDGLNTMVGERGARLSGGQRQRLGIARALYHRPSILVLDEATSALDGETEAAVLKAVQSLKGSITMITIAHRLNTIRDCDWIFQLENGAMTQQGTYDQVIEGAES